MHRYFASVVVLACSLMACAQDTADKLPSPSQQLNPSATSTGTPLPPIRIILQFKNSADFQSDAFLQKLHIQTQAQVRYIAPVFGDTHVYGFQPPAGQSYAQLLQRLNSMPGVVRVEVDQKAQPQ